MTDLFSAQPAQPKVGTGNAIMLADVAQGLARDVIRQRYRQGDYPGADPKFIDANLKLWGK